MLLDFAKSLWMTFCVLISLLHHKYIPAWLPKLAVLYSKVKKNSLLILTTYQSRPKYIFSRYMICFYHFWVRKPWFHKNVWIEMFIAQVHTYLVLQIIIRYIHFRGYAQPYHESRIPNHYPVVNSLQKIFFWQKSSAIHLFNFCL